MQTFDYVIYHKYCLDGFAGFFVLTKTNLMDEKCVIFPDKPSTTKIPLNISDKNIIIIDVAYKNSILEEIIKVSKTTLFLDHHVTIYDGTMKLLSKYADKFTYIYNVEKSGCSITWDYFFANKKLPKFLKYIEDNDIGRWKYKYTKAFVSALQIKMGASLDIEILKKWDKLFDKAEVTRLINMGIKYNEYEKYMVEKKIKNHEIKFFPSKKLFENINKQNDNFFLRPGQYKVAIMNGGCPSTGMTGTELVRRIECDFAIVWEFSITNNRYILSFRSEGTDVGRIASIFGGGGHIYAAACTIYKDKYDITDLFQ